MLDLSPPWLQSWHSSQPPSRDLGHLFQLSFSLLQISLNQCFLKYFLKLCPCLSNIKISYPFCDLYYEKHRGFFGLFSKTKFCFPKKRFIFKDHNPAFAFSCVNSSLLPGDSDVHLREGRGLHGSPTALGWGALGSVSWVLPLLTPEERQWSLRGAPLQGDSRQVTSLQTCL